MEVIEADALKIELPHFDRIVSNLPYSISSPIIFKVLGYQFKRAILMLQKEFADRMVARPDTDDYSRLSVNVYFHAKCEILEKVPRSRFWPVPKVDSAIIQLDPRPAPFELVDKSLFFELTDNLFQQRRKMIGTILRDRGTITAEQRKCLPFMDLRVEALSPEQICELSNAISSMKGVSK